METEVILHVATIFAASTLAYIAAFVIVVAILKSMKLTGPTRLELLIILIYIVLVMLGMLVGCILGISLVQ